MYIIMRALLHSHHHLYSFLNQNITTCTCAFNLNHVSTTREGGYGREKRDTNRQTYHIKIGILIFSVILDYWL